MPSYVTPKKNTAFRFYISLVSQANLNIFQVNPTMAAGDVKYSIDGGAFQNLNTLPAATPAGGSVLQVDLLNTEMNGDNIVVKFSDAAGAEWCDATVNIQTTAGQIDEIVLVDTVTNLTNAPSSGDLTATMKTSVGTAVSGQLTATIADSVPADGTRPSIAQALYMLVQFLSERSISGTTMTVKKPDGTTALMTFTLNDAVNPTSLTRAT